jgi:hypothetical protein
MEYGPTASTTRDRRLEKDRGYVEVFFGATSLETGIHIRHVHVAPVEHPGQQGPGRANGTPRESWNNDLCGWVHVLIRDERVSALI